MARLACDDIVWQGRRRPAHRSRGAGPRVAATLRVAAGLRVAATLLGATLLGATLLAACSSSSPGPSSSGSPSSTSPSSTSANGAHAIPIAIFGGQGMAQGARPIVEVRVGSSKAVPVLLDTGSSGLRIFGAPLGLGNDSGVNLTTKQSRLTYSGGQRFVGVVASAIVSVGSASTAKPVDFELVQEADCISSRPDCQASGGETSWEQGTGTDGILGIGLVGNADLDSPLVAMLGQLGQSWSIHMHEKSGTLTLGAVPPTPSDSVTVIKLRPAGSEAGSTLWADDSLRFCLQIGDKSACLTGIMDSGVFTTQLSGPAFSSLPAASTTPDGESQPRQTPVAAGLAVAFTVQGASKPLWSFTSGTLKSQNELTLLPNKGNYVNTGVAIYFAFTVTFSEMAGTITLSHP